MDYKNCTGFINVEYDEPKQSTYRSIKLHIRETTVTDSNEIIFFDSGNPILDFYALQKWLGKHELAYATNSSSVDHFFMDGNKWVELPLLPDNPTVENIDEWIITTWENFHEKYPDKYINDDFIYVCVTSRWIGKSFADLKKYYLKKIDKNNPLYYENKN